MFRRKLRRSREWNKNNKIINFEKARAARRQNREEQNEAQKEAKPEPPSKRKRIKLNRKRNFYSALLLIVVVVFSFSIINMISANSQLKDVAAERAVLELEREGLEYTLQNVDSEEYIEQQARTMLKMIRPGEIYFVVPSEEE